MPQNEHQLLRAPIGMAPATDPGNMPEDKAMFIKGFRPGEGSSLRLSYPLVAQEPTKNYMQGWPLLSMVYNNPTLDASGHRQDKVIVVLNGGYVYMHSKDIVSYAGKYNTPLLGPGALVGQIPYVIKPLVPSQRFSYRAVQYRDEIYITDNYGGSWPYRFTLDPVTGLPLLYRLGIQTPVTGDWTLSVQAGAGITGNFDYELTWYDERGRESSPSPSKQVVLANQRGRHVITWPADRQIRGCYIYRRNSTTGGTYYRSVGATNLLGSIPRTGTTDTFDDYVPDDSVMLANQIAPLPGENDPPHKCTIMYIHKNRLILDDNNVFDSPNDTSCFNRFQQSNADAPTQFSSVSSQDLPGDGTSLTVGTDPGDRITGFIGTGSFLGIFKRRGYHELWGDDITNWTIRPKHSIGCMSAESVVAAGVSVIWRGEDGFYWMHPMTYNVPTRISDDITSKLQGRILGGGNTTVPSWVFYEPWNYPVTNADYFKSFEGIEDIYPLSGIPAPEVTKNTFAEVQPPEGISTYPIRDYQLDYPLFIDEEKSYTHAFYYRGVYYASEAGHTYAFNVTNPAWTDCGYGNIRFHGKDQTEGQSEGVFLCANPSYGIPIPFVSYLSNESNITQYNAYNSWLKRIRWRPHDGKGVSRERVKRATRLTIFGDIFPPSTYYPDINSKDLDNVVGELRLISDTGYMEVYPIKNHMILGYKTGMHFVYRIGSLNGQPPRTYPRGTLLVQHFSTSMRGRLLSATLTWTGLDVIIRDALLEYVPIT